MLNQFRIVNGKIQDDMGYIIDNMSIIYQENVGIFKYGDYKDIMPIYNHLTLELNQEGNIGKELIKEFSVINLSTSDKELSLNEICTFANYMVMVSANSENIEEMLKMSKEGLKVKLKELNMKSGF